MTRAQARAAYDLYKQGWTVEELKTIYRASDEWWNHFKQEADKKKVAEPWCNRKKDLPSPTKTSPES